MKKKTAFILLPLLLVVSLTYAFHRSDGADSPRGRNAELQARVRFLLAQLHYNPVAFDDEFSAKAFDRYLSTLDNNKRFFLKSDYEEMAAFRERIDDEVRNQTNMLFDMAYGKYGQRVEQAEALCGQILEEPFDFAVDESFESDPDKRDYAENEEQLRETWRKRLKFETLVRYHSMVYDQEQRQKKQEEGESQEEAKDPLTLEEIEAKAREEVGNSYQNLFKSLKKLDEEDHISYYVNAFAAVFGPHTEYLPAQEKEDFDIEMSGKLEGIGAQLLQRDGEIEVSRIIPGSPSWKGDELKEGDVILKVSQGAEGEAVSIVDMPLSDAVQLIRGKKGTEVVLTVRKPDGRIDKISIIRDVVELEDTYARSAVLRQQTLDRESNPSPTAGGYGYIQLPSFYADFDSEDGRSSASDMKKELERLNDVGVAGVIIDLRNNGGGSLRDVIEMSGFFIDTGTIVQTRDRAGNAVPYKDEARGTVFDKPVVVMVNRFSASASEILAAALQDYERAIVVGSASTFGKGTVQRFYDLDMIGEVPREYGKLGALKLTTQKFYRVTGKTTQFRGVVPDIILPDVYDYLDIGEKDMEHALPFDEISPIDNYQPLPNELPRKYLQKRSEKRTKGVESFAMIEKQAKRLRREQDKTLEPLNYEQFREEQRKLREEAEKFRSFEAEFEELEVIGLLEESGTESEELATIKAERFRRWQESLKGDAYLFEATNVLSDLIGKSK